MPGPVSTHGQADRIGLRAVRDLERDSAAVRELDAVAEQVEQHLAQLLAIADHRRRHALRNRQVEGELLLPGAALHQHHDVLDQLVQVEDRALHLDLTRFDPRVVEDVVEDTEQNFTRRAHDPDLLALPLVERTVGHEPQHAENPVHRGADLMAHGGEELRLGAARLLGAGAGAIVVAHLLDQPGIGLGQLRRAFRDQSLQVLLVLPQLGVGLFPLLLKLSLVDRLVAEDAHRIGHVGQLVPPSSGHIDVEPPRREALHDPVQRREPVDDVAMDVEPGNGDRDRDEQHDLEQDGEAAELDGTIRRRGCVGGDLLGTGDDRRDALVHPVGQGAVVVRQDRERCIEVQRPAALAEQAERAGRPVGGERGDERPRLLAADRVIDQRYPAL